MTANVTKIAIAAIPLALGGCAHIAGINQPARAGHAHVSISRLDGGRPAVTVFHVKSRSGLFTGLNIPPNVHEIASFALRPGEHTLEVACLRPNAVDIVDGSWFFDVAVEANRTYVLDCAPTKAEGNDYYYNHFSLIRVDTGDARESTLEPGTWIGCYDFVVRKNDDAMPLGRVRLIDQRAPGTAGKYEAHVVKSLANIAWSE
jgi:hypothetical protein